ncbi:hypothetical protein K505DRAFT_53130 [Melanomma pulvis-pyrius CBS 109.77]|uniref:Uncharacterized protein n=1 Tax=Melanomma pulvis-pyrius CBS 109.77 TaxID=1314802 RepID=A0A6A6X951_9PLEO|nr:hypothetical protein K505DRAFT_53130 [Melanomma pulvis-pyrius CBS 109.77]
MLKRYRQEVNKNRKQKSKNKKYMKEEKSRRTVQQEEKKERRNTRTTVQQEEKKRKRKRNNKRAIKLGFRPMLGIHPKGRGTCRLSVEHGPDPNSRKWGISCMYATRLTTCNRRKIKKDLRRNER